MQNTSIATYAKLLPGLTNLTRRMRYYGLYMWLLEQYAKEINKVSIVEYQKFMRRGELLLAFIMSYKLPDEQGVVGSQYAKKYLSEHKDIIAISEGADRNSERRTYWKYSTGAFGQYYQGALTAIGLIAHSERDKRLSVCTPDRGRRLAEYFENMTTEDSRKQYLQIIESGNASIEDLALLGDEFSLTGIVPGTDEWKFYINLLFGPDYPTIEVPAGHSTFRRETIILYLEYLSDAQLNASAGGFPWSFYLRKWKKTPFIDYIASSGWYYYALNENAHYCMETFLWALLVELNSRGQVLLHAIIKDFAMETYKALEVSSSFSFKIDETLSFDDFAEKLYREGFHPSTHTDAINQIKPAAIFEGVAHAMCSGYALSSR